MKTISIDSSLFARPIENDPRFKYNKKQETLPKTIELHVPDRLEQRILERYILNCVENNRPVHYSQLDALSDLLEKADAFGHNINELLTVATASNWSRVVFDNHLKPLDKSS